MKIAKRKWTSLWRIGMCAFFFVSMITACGPSVPVQIKASIKDECSGNGNLAFGAAVSLAPTEDGQQFDVKNVDIGWQGTTAATKTDGSGAFSFGGIPEGKYGLFVVGSQVMANTIGDVLILDIKKDGIQDLGVLRIIKTASGVCMTIINTP